MAERWLRVRLDLNKLRAALSREDGRQYSSGEVRMWLLDAGFRPSEENWLVREVDLGQVQPGEVLILGECLGPTTDWVEM
jgi:hypothetical protein